MPAEANLSALLRKPLAGQLRSAQAEIVQLHCHRRSVMIKGSKKHDGRPRALPPVRKRIIHRPIPSELFPSIGC